MMTSLKPPRPQDVSSTGTSAPRSVLYRRRWWITASFGLAFLAAGTFHALQWKAARPPKDASASAVALTVTVAPVETGAVPHSLMVTGSLAARDELPIGTETSELAISQVLVDVGEHVRQGQLLARFNDGVLRAQVQQAEAALNEALANATEASANAQRADELAKTGWMSGKDHDNRHAAALTTQARVGVAQANLALALAKLKQAELRAPSDGTITLRNAHLGAVVSAGNGELFRMIRDDLIELVAELPETDLMAVSAGQPVLLSVDGAGDRQGNAAGVVRLVEPTVDVKTRIGRVRVDVEKNDGLLPGMFVTGRIILGRTETPVVPERAVVYQNGKPSLFVIDNSGNAVFRAVTLGPRDQGRIAVLSGIVAGERVALQGAGYLKNGDRVSIADALPESFSPNPTSAN
jgi:RND family efflux transporter MFP subunit